MRKALIAGYLFTVVMAGCAPRPPLSAAIPITAPSQAPEVAPTSAAKVIQTPPSCRGADLIYHTRFRQMLLVNCVADPNVLALLTIWHWDGTKWERVTQDGPPGRMLGGAAYDDIRDVLVLYGGRPIEPGRCSQETWEWDGEFWEQLNASPPTACDHVRMVYDKSIQRSILFSGLDPSQDPVDETWSWNGERWKLLSAEGPASRGHFGFVYDPSHRQTLLFGGYTGNVSNEFWVWKNNTWEQLDSPAPGALSHFGTAFDTDTNALYIFGGATSGSTYASLTDKTWVLSDGHWKELHPADAPSARGGPAMGYDPERKRVILYGGFDSGRNNLNDVWEWDGRDWICMTNCD